MKNSIKHKSVILQLFVLKDHLKIYPVHYSVVHGSLVQDFYLALATHDSPGQLDNSQLVQTMFSEVSPLIMYLNVSIYATLL